jgi:glycosyltransferase involved in cell wall biosynthesis
VQDERYFEELIAPRVDGDNVSFVGAVEAAQRSELLGGAEALLHPIGFAEPFGYSVVEAMACGTPVVAFNRGSMPELIDDGISGFLVDDVDGAVRAVPACAALDRAAIRAQTVERFGVSRMVNAYIEAYEAVLTCSRR